MPRKKYNLKCFHCRQPFKSKKEVHRTKYMSFVQNGIPLCEECYINTEQYEHNEFIEHTNYYGES